MKVRPRIWIGILLTLLMSAEAAARLDIVPGSRYTSARGSAMGDNYLPVGDDGVAGLFYNPANLGKPKYPDVEPINFEFYGDTGLIQSSGANNFFQIFSLNQYASQLNKNPGTSAGFGTSLFPNLYMRGWAFGILYQVQNVAVADGKGNIHSKSLYQLIPTVGTGIRLAQGIIRIGYSLQWVQQASGTVDSTNPTGWNQNLYQGSGFSNNVGFAMTLPVAYLPALNLVARNVLTLKYLSQNTMLSLGKNSVGQLSNEPMTLDASVSVQPKLGSGVYANLVLEMRDMTNTSGVPIFLGRLGPGAEISFRDHFFIRTGIGSGYPSAGIGFRRALSEFALTWYSEEVGASYLTRRDTRILMQYQIGTF